MQLEVYFHACSGMVRRHALLNRTLGGAGVYAEFPKLHEGRITSRIQGRMVPFRVMPFPLVESVYSIHQGCWPTPAAYVSPKAACKRLNSTWFC